MLMKEVIELLLVMKRLMKKVRPLIELVEEPLAAKSLILVKEWAIERLSVVRLNL